MMGKKDIREELFGLRDEKYAAFQSKLIPGTDPAAVIGVRLPALRRLAKEIVKDGRKEEALRLPHEYYDEYQLHAFVISLTKDFGECVAETEEFLPYIDNWAVCDTLSPVAFTKNRERLIPLIMKWIRSDRIYTVRFGIHMLMSHFLGDSFSTEYPELVAGISSSEYYVNMMRAWYFATALAKQYDSVIPFLEDNKLDRWTHNKTIQKSIESYRISDDRKEYLKSLRLH